MHVLESLQKPERIWNVDETRLQMKHNPTMIVCVPGEKMEGYPLRWGNTGILRQCFKLWVVKLGVL